MSQLRRYRVRKSCLHQVLFSPSEKVYPAALPDLYLSNPDFAIVLPKFDKIDGAAAP